MSERTKYAAGTPCWVDLGSPDPDASAKFYSELLGWTAGEPGPIEETGGYRMFTLRGKNVAGLGPLQGEGQPPSWTTYVSVDDADKTAATVTENGGTVIAEPFDVLDAGRMAIFMDPTGAAFAVWQPNLHIGAQFANEPGALCWNELNTRDAKKAAAFYSTVFGWRPDTQEMGGQEYTLWMVGDDGVAGMMPMPDSVPAEVPSFWMVSFAVDNCDESVTKLQSLGGSVMAEAMDMEGVGRLAVLMDSQGASFAIIQLAQPA